MFFVLFKNINFNSQNQYIGEICTKWQIRTKWHRECFWILAVSLTKKYELVTTCMPSYYSAC